jgi:hypothetical protein
MFCGRSGIKQVVVAGESYAPAWQIASFNARGGFARKKRRFCMRHGVKCAGAAGGEENGERRVKRKRMARA